MLVHLCVHDHNVNSKRDKLRMRIASLVQKQNSIANLHFMTFTHFEQIDKIRRGPKKKTTENESGSK